MQCLNDSDCNLYAGIWCAAIGCDTCNSRHSLCYIWLSINSIIWKSLQVRIYFLTKFVGKFLISCVSFCHLILTWKALRANQWYLIVNSVAFQGTRQRRVKLSLSIISFFHTLEDIHSSSSLTLHLLVIDYFLQRHHFSLSCSISLGACKLIIGMF